MVAREPEEVDAVEAVVVVAAMEVVMEAGALVADEKAVVVELGAVVAAVGREVNAAVSKVDQNVQADKGVETSGAVARAARLAKSVGGEAALMVGMAGQAMV